MPTRPIKFQCPHCGGAVTVPEDMATTEPEPVDPAVEVVRSLYGEQFQQAQATKAFLDGMSPRTLQVWLRDYLISRASIQQDLDHHTGNRGADRIDLDGWTFTIDLTDPTASEGWI